MQCFHCTIAIAVVFLCHFSSGCNFLLEKNLNPFTEINFCRRTKFQYWCNLGMREAVTSIFSLHVFYYFDGGPSKRRPLSLCSRNFQNMKLRRDFVEILSLYCHSHFKQNQTLANSNGPKMSFGNFRDPEFWIFGKFGTWKLLKFTKIKIQNL